MKKTTIILLAILCLSALGASAQKHRGRTTARTTSPSAFSMKSPRWSKNISLNQDISRFSYEELYYLRALVYATHGKWYTEGEISQMIMSKASWYEPLVTKRAIAFDNQGGDTYSDEFLEGTPLSTAEKTFVAKIDARMDQLRQQNMQGRTLESPSLCINMCQLEKPSADILSRLDKYNFAIEQTDCEQLFNIYEQNDYSMMPSFVTTDAYLQVAHMYLAYVQKYIEQTFFTKSLAATLTALHNRAMSDAEVSTGAARERAGFVAAYAAVGLNLLTGKNNMSIPPAYREVCAGEIANIEAAADRPSPMLDTSYDFFYSLFRPRGHYTRSEEAKRFFKAMMWVQTARFESNNEQMMRNAFAIALTYNELTPAQREEFEHMSDVISQLTGPSDNVSILQMASYLSANGITDASAIDSPEVYAELLTAMKQLNSSQNRLSTVAEADCGFYINLMPQRFLVDNDVLRRMVDEKPNAERAFPRGLDVFAAFGSKSADDVLLNFYHDDAKWDKYSSEMARMKATYSNGKVGQGTIYDRRLQILVNLCKEHPSALQYSFYNTTDWQKKELNTALASWATLKHDAILYAEQPMLAECGSGELLPPPVPMGFVEPNVRFWNELSSIISDTQEWLSKGGFLDDELKEKTENLLENVNFCKDMAIKESKGEVPSLDECGDIKRIGSTLEWITLGLIDPALQLTSWDDLQGADRSIAQVADIFTRGVQGCTMNGVLYSACGNANAIYVLVKIGGKTYITRGATYAYYEFTLPLDHPRLTDEDWQKELEKGTYSMPQWMAPYIIGGKTTVNEANFYGSGC